jgi:hypothetical protein
MVEVLCYKPEGWGLLATNFKITFPFLPYMWSAPSHGKPRTSPRFIVRISSTADSTATNILVGVGGWIGTKSFITEAITGLLYLSRMMLGVEKVVECLTRQTKILGEILPQCCIAHHKSHMSWPWPRWEACDWPPELRHGCRLWDKMSAR